MRKTVSEIAHFLGGTVIGNGTQQISGVCTMLAPEAEHLTFIEQPDYLQALEHSAIACIIVPVGMVPSSSKTLIAVARPKLAFARLSQLFHPQRTFPKTISAQARIAPSAHLAAGVTVEDFVVIGEHVRIGKNAVIRSFTYIDEGVTIGENTIIHPHVMIYDHTTIGNNVIIHSSTVIGADGFGYARDEQNNHVKVPQLGTVIIEDEVEIGSNTSIDRATFGATIIRKGAKIDNLVQVAHNVDIGEETAISGQSGIAGSSKVGDHCTIAAQVGIADHCTIEDHVILGGQTGVPSKKRISTNNFYMGTPARPLTHFKQQQKDLVKLPSLIEQVKELQTKVAQWESPDVSGVTKSKQARRQ